MKNKKRIENYNLFFRKGFTLIEMLLVIAIIGILASMVFAMIGNSDNSRRKAALSTTRSIMSYAQECYFLKNELSIDAGNEHSGGGPICPGSVTPWPKLSVDGCNYESVSGYNYTVNCGSIGNIVCDAFNGTCIENAP